MECRKIPQHRQSRKRSKQAACSCYTYPKSVATAVEESHHHLPLMSGLWNEAGGERRQRATGKAKIAEKPMSRTVAKVAVAWASSVPDWLRESPSVRTFAEPWVADSKRPAGTDWQEQLERQYCVMMQHRRSAFRARQKAVATCCVGNYTPFSFRIDFSNFRNKCDKSSILSVKMNLRLVTLYRFSQSPICHGPAVESSFRKRVPFFFLNVNQKNHELFSIHVRFLNILELMKDGRISNKLHLSLMRVDSS